MNKSHWHTRVTHWNNLTAPLRPTPETLAKHLELVGAHTNQVLVLGVTPEFTTAWPCVYAVDKEQVMIDRFWQPDPNKQVQLADWLSVDLPSSSMSAVVGDGSLNMVQFPLEAQQLLQRICTWLEPGGVVAVRLFGRPYQPITQDELINATKTLNWHTWRTYLSMYIAGQTGVNVTSKSRLATFNQLFPNRELLCADTGWDLEEVSRTMDSYEFSNTSTSFPIPQQWLEILPPQAENAALIAAGDYALSEFFPILTFSRKTNG